MDMRVGLNQSNRRIIQLKNPDGTSVGTISFTKSAKKKTSSLPKKHFQYNFKRISSQILSTKTSFAAGQIVTKARGQVAALQAKLIRYSDTEDFDYDELKNAIIHARKMERIARKKMKHLKEEELSEQNRDQCDKDKIEETMQDNAEAANTEISEELKLNEEELKRLLRELQEKSQQSMKELYDELQGEMQSDELSDLCIVVTGREPEQLERLKKKHRTEETRDIASADLEYLKFLFQKLERERQEISAGIARQDTAQLQDSFSGISMQLSGIEMSVPVTEMPVSAEGGNVDICV